MRLRSSVRIAIATYLVILFIGLVATLLACVLSTAIAATLERMTLIAEADPERYALLARLLRGVGLGFLLARSGAARR